MNNLSFFRRTKSRYAMTRLWTTSSVLETMRPSAFDVATDEQRTSDAEAWAKLERDIKP